MSLVENKDRSRDNSLANLRMWQPGQSGNPGGRPKNTLKEYAKLKLANMTEEEREEFLSGIDKKTIWEMSEGKPKQDTEISGELITKIISVDE